MKIDKLFLVSEESYDTSQAKLDPFETRQQPQADEQLDFTTAYEKDALTQDDRQEFQQNAKQERPQIQNTTDHETIVMPSPVSLMRSLFAERMTESTPIKAVIPTLKTDVVDNIEKLVESILVSEPAQDTQEVQINLNSGLLHGAKVKIQRHTDGQLVVRVNCPDANAFQTAVEAQQTLTDALLEHDKAVRVIVDRGDVDRSNNDNSGDARQRSRGLQNINEEDVYR